MFYLEMSQNIGNGLWFVQSYEILNLFDIAMLGF